VYQLVGKEDPVVFDVGANEGQTIDRIREVFSKPRIYAFEPSPATFQRLLKSHDGVPFLKIDNRALGANTTSLPFHVTSEHSVNDSILTSTGNWDTRAVQVAVSTIDDVCKEFDISTIDFLKIDTQGYDLQVLRGARKMLSERRIRSVLCEVIFQSMYHDQPQLTEFLALLSSIGYQLFGIYEQHYLNRRLSHFNVCFVSPCI
jgi:FkbM family methyltransferase